MNLIDFKYVIRLFYAVRSSTHHIVFLVVPLFVISFTLFLKRHAITIVVVVVECKQVHIIICLHIIIAHYIQWCRKYNISLFFFLFFFPHFIHCIKYSHSCIDFTISFSIKMEITLHFFILDSFNGDDWL